MSNSNLELKDLTKFRLDKINKIKDYLNSEIKERKDIIKKISKYIVAFDYADKLLHYQHHLALQVLCHMQRLFEYL